jgi:hypothetical protein
MTLEAEMTEGLGAAKASARMDGLATDAATRFDLSQLALPIMTEAI